MALKVLAKLPPEALKEHAAPAVVELLRRDPDVSTQKLAFEVLERLQPSDLASLAGSFGAKLTTLAGE